MTTTTPTTKRSTSASTPRNNRARVSNGALLPRGIDGRSTAGRRWKDLYREFRAALPQAPTIAQDALLRSLVGATMALEQIGAQQASGSAVDDERLVALANLQGRLLDRLGIAPATASEPPKPDPIAAHRKRMGWDR